MKSLRTTQLSSFHPPLAERFVLHSLNMLSIKNLHVTVDNKEVVKGVSLDIRPGEIHAIMGPNGSGKSSLAMAIVGHPRYEVARKGRGTKAEGRRQSTIELDGTDITNKTPDERARMGLFLAMQYPISIDGITVEQLLHRAKQEGQGPRVKGQGNSPDKKIDMFQFRKQLEKLAEKVGVTKELLHRSLNVGFSGGEKKRLEILQMLVLQPKYAILDETDSGLDIDALRIISRSINRFVHQLRITNHQSPGVLVITHYARLLKYLKPDMVHIMKEGKIIRSGSKRLAQIVEEKGYQISN